MCFLQNNCDLASSKLSASLQNSSTNQQKKPRCLHQKESFDICVVLHFDKLVFRQQNNQVLSREGNADLSGVKTDRKSITGFFFKNEYTPGAKSWQIGKQKAVAFPSCKAEYQRFAAAAQKFLFP